MENVPNPETIAALEALLFSHGEPIVVSRVATFLGISESMCEAIVSALDETLTRDPARGLTVMRRNTTVQLVTKSMYASVVEKIMKDEFRETLTPASLEVLSLIAYFGPIARVNVEYVRGVNSSFTMRNLLMRGLIERVAGERTSRDGYEYDITFHCLHHLGVQKREELPEYEAYRARFAAFDVAQNTEEHASTGTGSSPSL
jgi:segregation and condensation protein B